MYNPESSSPDGFFDGEIAEFMVFDCILSDDELKQVNQYLEKKWGISLSQ